MEIRPDLPGMSMDVWMHHLDAKKTAGEEARRQLYKNAASNIEQAPTIRPPVSHHENYPS